jgi:hypothetical protein
MSDMITSKSLTVVWMNCQDKSSEHYEVVSKIFRTGVAICKAVVVARKHRYQQDKV